MLEHDRPLDAIRERVAYGFEQRGGMIRAAVRPDPFRATALYVRRGDGWIRVKKGQCSVGNECNGGFWRLRPVVREGK